MQLSFQQVAWTQQELAAQPVDRLIEDPNKWHCYDRVVANRQFPYRSVVCHQANGEVTRNLWRRKAPPLQSDTLRDGYYDYASDSWWINFADHRLFGYVHTGLLAQDEMQVLEHPLAYGLRMALENAVEKGQLDKSFLYTYQSHPYCPTPILIEGLQRLAQLRGVYGHKFASMTPEQLDQHLTILPTVKENRLIAMAALPPTHTTTRNYTNDEVFDLFYTAFLAFSAAHSISGKETVIATGNWGCGAFGHDVSLIALLQHMAAAMANVKMEYFCGDQAEIINVALAKYRPRQGQTLEQWLNSLAAGPFSWSSGNGT